MAKEFFENWAPKMETIETLASATHIINQYKAQGYTLSLRQLYYQLVASDIIPNKDREYKRLGRIINRGRLAGLVDWDLIEDRNRELAVNSHWTSPKSILQTASSSFKLDLWEDQDYRLIVMSEKDALSGVLGKVAREWDVMYTANKGYASASHLYDIAQRARGWIEDEDQETIVLYFGDFDPSGLDMDRDLEDRLSLFSTHYQEVERLALLRDQIDTYNPPPNPAKLTDTRADSYISVHGYHSWELDALRPEVLATLAEEAIMSYLDYDKYEAKVEQQQAYRDELLELSKKYD